MTSLQVQFKGQIKDIPLPRAADTTWAQLQSLLEDEFAVPSDAQRVFFNKKRIEPESATDNTTLRELGWDVATTTAPRIMLMAGASKDQIEEMKKTKEAVEAEQRIRANRRVVSVEKRNQQFEAREAVATEYRFHSIKVLENLPESDRARSILEQLANDRGVLAVMAKHKWSVGCLAEMYPDGKVGVDPVCVLGLNTNKGQKIELRLRTDDLRGFRKFLSIKKVLYHELSHNVHSEHDSKFYQLMRQVERECDELDWSHSSGRAVGGSAGIAVIPDRDDSSAGSGQRLGGGTNGVSRLLASAAPSPPPLPVEERASTVSFVPEKHPSTTTEEEAGVITIDNEAMEVCDPEPTTNGTIIIEADDSQNEGPQLDQSDTATQHISLLDASCFGDYQPSERELRMRTALESLRVTYASEVVSATASFMHKVVSNIVQNPSEPKYKSIRKSNRLFASRLACYPQCLDFLQAIGFDDQGESYVLARHDPALLWIGRSLLELLIDPKHQ